MLYADGERLVPGTIAPATVGVRVTLGARRAQAEAGVRIRTADIAAARAEILCRVAEQIAVDLEIAVHVTPRPGRVRRKVSNRVPCASAQPPNVLAPVRFEGRLAIAEQVV